MLKRPTRKGESSVDSCWGDLLEMRASGHVPQFGTLVVCWTLCSDPAWGGVLRTLVSRFSEDYKRVVVLDLSLLESGIGRPVSSRIPSLMQFYRLQPRDIISGWSACPDNVAVEVVTDLDARMLRGGLTRGATGLSSQICDSELATRVWHGLEAGVWGARQRARMYSSAEAVYWALGTTLLTLDASDVCVLNGRSASQRAAVTVARRLGRTIRFAEVARCQEAADLKWSSRCLRNIYLDQYQVHDREAFQRRLIENFETSATPVNALIEEAEHLVEARRSDRRTNRFLVGSRRDDPKSLKSRRVVFFTSSPDEFVGLDLDCWLSEWESQEEAILALCRKCATSDTSLVVRVHPNLLTKSYREIRRVSKFCSSLPVDVTVIGPASHVDSYSLGEDAQAVFVWSSTIGAELSLLRVPVYVMHRSFYDIVADVRTVPSASVLDSLDFKSLRWDVDPFGAALCLSGIDRAEMPILIDGSGNDTAFARRPRPKVRWFLYRLISKAERFAGLLSSPVALIGFLGRSSGGAWLITTIFRGPIYGTR